MIISGHHHLRHRRNRHDHHHPHHRLHHELLTSVAHVLDASALLSPCLPLSLSISLGAWWEQLEPWPAPARHLGSEFPRRLEELKQRCLAEPCPPSLPGPGCFGGTVPLEPVTLAQPRPIQQQMAVAAAVLPEPAIPCYCQVGSPNPPEALRENPDREEMLMELKDLKALVQGKEELKSEHAQKILLAQERLAQEQEELLRGQSRCKELEVEMVLQRKDLQMSQEWQTWQQQKHSCDLQHQAEVLQLRYEANLLSEQETWQQMESSSQSLQRQQAERAREWEMRDLAASVETERFLATELRAQSRISETSKLRLLQELSARLAGRELEILALESSEDALEKAKGQAQALQARLSTEEAQLQEARSQLEQTAADAASAASAASAERVAEARAEAETSKAEARLQAAEAQLQTELRATTASAEALCHAQEQLQQAQDAQRASQEATAEAAAEGRARELALEQRLEDLQMQLEELRAAQAQAPKPAVSSVPAVSSSDYVATADLDLLDQALEAEIRSLGPGCLQGHVLTRTGPKIYKLGADRVRMQLSDSVITVRVGTSWVPLARWVRELPAPGEQAPEDQFQALDASSPFAGVYPLPQPTRKEESLQQLASQPPKPEAVSAQVKVPPIQPPTPDKPFYNSEGVDLMKLSNEELEKYVPMDENGRRTSIGAINHPTECSPCIFWFRHVCEKGLRCEFCHIKHPGQVGTLIVSGSRCDDDGRTKFREASRGGALRMWVLMECTV
ncbi:unnamed protein product [Symbiodinium sp. CCMP2592]|nr:unnamed protein product [Symbiodinium sp. CCMP2592]